MPYIDTSVLVPFYYPEPLSDKAQQLLRKTSGPGISALCEVEFASALAAKVRAGAYAGAAARAVLAQFRTHVAEGYYRRLAVDEAHSRMAADWLGRFSTPLRTLDALHLAVAHANREMLVTGDKHLAESARQLRVACRLL
jgi:uncharacterized protein